MFTHFRIKKVEYSMNLQTDLEQYSKVKNIIVIYYARTNEFT